MKTTSASYIISLSIYQLEWLSVRPICSQLVPIYGEAVHTFVWPFIISLKITRKKKYYSVKGFQGIHILDNNSISRYSSCTLL